MNNLALILSIFGSLVFAGVAIINKVTETDRKIDTSVVNNVMVLSAVIMGSIILAFVNQFIKAPILKLNTIALTAGVFGYLATLMLNKSIQYASNPALTVALFRSQIIVTAIIAYIVFKSKMTNPMLACIGVIILSAFAIAISSNETDKDKNKKETTLTTNWIFYAIIAIIAVSFADNLMKYSSILKYNYLNSSLYVLLGNLLGLIIYYIVDSKQLTVLYNNTDVIYKNIYLLVLSGLCFGLHMISLTSAINFSSNPAIVKAIITLDIVLIAIVSGLINAESKLNMKQWISCITLCGGIVGISLLE